LEQLAVQNEKKVPKPRICVRDGVCNLSGLENMALKLLAETGDKPLVAAFVLEFIAQTLAAMAAFARREDGGLPLLFAGGVMSNRLIAKRLCETLGGCYFAEPPFSADNAAGVALLCRAAALNS
jgi:N6-L-threonylcarbamoyladenine synthase